MLKDYFLGDYDEVKHVLRTVVQAGASVRLCVQGQRFLKDDYYSFYLWPHHGKHSVHMCFTQPYLMINMQIQTCESPLQLLCLISTIVQGCWLEKRGKFGDYNCDAPAALIQVFQNVLNGTNIECCFCASNRLQFWTSKIYQANSSRSYTSIVLTMLRQERGSVIPPLTSKSTANEGDAVEQSHYSVTPQEDVQSIYSIQSAAEFMRDFNGSKYGLASSVDPQLIIWTG